MSRYQQAPYSDQGGYGNSYANQGGGGGGGQGYGGYSDEPSGGYGDGGYAKQGNPSGYDSYPMSSSNPYAATSSQRGYATDKPKSKRKWWIIGGIIALLIIIGAVLGGVLGTQLNKKNGNSSSGSGSNSGAAAGNGNAVPSGLTGSINTGALTATAANRVLAVATDSAWMLPVYPTGTNTAGYSTPTTNSAAGAWPSDPSPPSNTSIRAHPRLIAPGYKWSALTSGLISSNPYFNQWNQTIVANATSTLGDAPVAYTPDGGLGGSGVLDVAREMKLKVKNWAYAYRVTNDTRFADRVWLELRTAAGANPDVSFGADGTRWNPQHFLDVAEFCNVFAIGYDWLYDRWTDAQRDQIMGWIMNLGLSFGEAALTGASSASAYSWWTGAPTNPQVNGNWNCVCNGGLLMASLAIVDRDTTGRAQRIIDLAIPSLRQNCFQGASSDGSWAEGPNYWYFGVNAAGELSSALVSAYGDDRGLAASNPGFALTSQYHMYVQGMTSLFNYFDAGPNKYASTANSLMYWATRFNTPRYALYQRDRYDSPEPFSMFWYDPSTSGTWWNDLAIDAHFPAQSTQWATGRSNWADLQGSFWAMKGGLIPGHQNHGNMDIGDFVVDAAGQRWFGDLGSGQYLADGYFSGEDSQNGTRYLYYRTRTEGQNTILVNNGNQLVSASPSGQFGSTGTKQGAAPSFNVSSTDTAFFTLDMSSAYASGSSLRRGIRFLNGRRQILIQDDISGLLSGQPVQWRAHTNATVTTNGATATLVLGGQTMIASLLNAPSGVSFGTAQPTRASSDPALGTGQYDYDPANTGVTVLTVNGPTDGSAWSNQVLLNPQWPAGVAAAAVTPRAVPVQSWSVTSHN